METPQDILKNSEGILGKILSPGSLNIVNATQFLKSTEANTLDPIVEELIHKEEFVLCSATAKTGKTFLAIELAKAVITGTPFLGRFETTLGRVLYFETELKPFYLKQRLEAILGNNESCLDRLFICKQSIKIDRSEGSYELVKAILDYKPDLIILDPFYKLHTKNEDKAQEITPVLTQLKELAQTYNVGFFVLHHEGKKGESNGNQISHRPRGSSAFADVPDVIISMTRDNDKKACRLAIENRNYKSSSLYIKLRADNSGWDVISDEKDDSLENSFDLQTIFYKLCEFPVSRSDLKNRVKDITGLSERSCYRKIADACKFGYLSEIDNAGVTFYQRTASAADKS